MIDDSKGQSICFVPGKDMYEPQMIRQWQIFFDGLMKADGSPWLTELEIKQYWNLR
jgi:shikimate dehydrogenase